jgi:hypothetical protein
VASVAEPTHLSFPTGCDEANRTVKAAIDLSASRGPWENPLGKSMVLWEKMGKIHWFYGKLWEIMVIII